MRKITVILVLGLGLGLLLRADVSLSVSFLSSERLTVFTRDAIWNKEPQPSYSATLVLLSSFEPNRREFIVFGDIMSGRDVPIENGLWDTRKFELGMGVGKMLTVPVTLTRLGIEFSLDFSAGPFAGVFLSNRYTHVGGKYVAEVERFDILGRIQYGLYAAARLRMQRFKKYLDAVDASLGFHFFIPFSNHEFNADPRARYHLFKTFAFAGISF
jgi:hypothetical protein